MLPAQHRRACGSISCFRSRNSSKRPSPAQVVPLDGVDVRFVSLEDLIVQKIIAGRPRDLEDAKSIVRKHPDLDRSFVKHASSSSIEKLDTDGLGRFQQMMAE